MSRYAFLAAVLALAPGPAEGCAKAFGKGTASTTKSAAPPPPPPVPVTSATAPPIWSPPDTGGPPPTLPPVPPELAKARALAQAGDHKKVRALLEKKVRAGKGSREEAALLMESCTSLRDKPCMDAVKAKHPEVDGP